MAAMANVSKKSAAEMTGELFREIGVLALVFYPVREGMGGEFSWKSAIFFIMGALGFWVTGVIIERWRTT